MSVTAENKLKDDARAVAASERAVLEQQVTCCPHSSWGAKGAAADMPDTGCLGAPLTLAPLLPTSQRDGRLL